MLAREALPARNSILGMLLESPTRMIAEAQKLVMPGHHDVRSENIDLKRLGTAIRLAHEKRPAEFVGLLLLQGMAPGTLHHCYR